MLKYYVLDDLVYFCFILFILILIQYFKIQTHYFENTSQYFDVCSFLTVVKMGFRVVWMTFHHLKPNKNRMSAEFLTWNTRFLYVTGTFPVPLSNQKEIKQAPWC